MNTAKNQLYAGIIWIISAIALAIYGIILFFNSNIPGIDTLVNFLSNINSEYLFLAAFISVFIEGLYFIGSFFPGASLVLLVTIISGTSGYMTFFITMVLIFIGWSLAGILNIYFAKVYRDKIIKLQPPEEYDVRDNVWTTWFPSFRSSYEVAQIIEGGPLWKVFFSSLKVRFWATLFVGCLGLIFPLFFNIQKTSDKESFLTIFIVFCISLIVGINKIRQYINNNQK